LNFKVDPNLKKNKFVAFGTSHIMERHHDDPNMSNHYVDWRNKPRWSEYLSKKLGYQNYYNRGRGSYGISTYPARLVSIVNDLKPSFVLIEIPSYERYEIAIEHNDYCRNDILSDNHWVEWGEHGYTGDKNIKPGTGNNKCIPAKYLYRINNGDTDVDPTDLEKFRELSTKIPASILQQSTRLNVYRNRQYYEDQTLSTCLMISGYLNDQKIDHAFFNFNSKVDKSIISKYNINYVNKQIGYKNIYNYINKDIDNPDYTDWYPDGTHLKSEHWIKIVDDIFIPYFEKHKL